MSNDQPLTPQEVADTLRIAKNTVYELIKRGELKGYRVGNKFRVNTSDLEAYRQARGVGSGGAVPGFGVGMAAQGGAGTKVIPGLAGGVGGDGGGLAGAFGAGLVPGANGGVADAAGVPGFVLCGQDVVLDMLAHGLEQALPGNRVYRSYLGSYNGLYALYQGQVQVASAHLWDSRTDSYNLPFLPHVLPGVRVNVVHVAGRTVGFYVPRGNPKGVRSWADLGRPELVLANRERGSGMRVLLDGRLGLAGLEGRTIPGYARSYPTHLAAALAVARASADYALGSEKACQQVGTVEFVPLQQERYDLVFAAEDAGKPLFRALVDLVQSRGFRDELTGLGGYDLAETGKVAVV